MLASKSSGAILSKTRAMFGRRLTVADYTALSQKRDLAGAASYLSSLEGYKDIFDGIDTASIHRMEFETILRHRHYRNFESLCRYELSIGEKFSDYIILATEMELITQTLSRVLSPKSRDAVIMTASPFLDKRLGLDLDAMGRAQSYGELLDAVKGSAFYGVLKRVGWHSTGELITYETALQAEFYRRIFEIIDESLHGEARDTLRDMFESRIDLENLSRVVRFKDYFKGATSEIIRTSLIPHGHVMGNTAVALAESKDSSAALSLAANMKPFRRKLTELPKCRRIDELCDRYMLRRCLHEIYFSPYPSVVMIAYLAVSEIEVANIIRIVEGIRYELSPSEIMDFLILPEEKRHGSDAV